MPSKRLKNTWFSCW